MREQNLALAKLFKIVVGPQFKAAYFWSARPRKILPVTLKSPSTKNVFNILKVAPKTKFVYLVCLKANLKRNYKNFALK